MSTYSWSYKTALHRQAPAKKTTDEAADIKNVTVPPLKPKQSVGNPNLKDSQSERPKRRKNIRRKVISKQQLYLRSKCWTSLSVDLQ